MTLAHLIDPVSILPKLTRGSTTLPSVRDSFGLAIYGLRIALAGRPFFPDELTA